MSEKMAKFMFSVEKEMKNKLIGYLKMDDITLTDFLVNQMEIKLDEYINNK